MKVFIEHKWNSRLTEVWVQEQQGSMKVMYDLKDNILVQHTLEPNTYIQSEEIKPFLTLPHDFLIEFIRALSDYMNEQGIKTENENLLQGKLQATEKHLEDLRKYVDRTLNYITDLKNPKEG